MKLKILVFSPEFSIPEMGGKSHTYSTGIFAQP